MQEHIYFGPVSEDVANEFETFEINGVNYDFHMEINVEDGFVRFSDSIGRMVPIDITELDSAIAALQLAKDIFNAKEIEAFVVDAEGNVEYI